MWLEEILHRDTASYKLCPQDYATLSVTYKRKKIVHQFQLDYWQSIRHTKAKANIAQRIVAALTDVALYNDGGPHNKGSSNIGSNDDKCLVNNRGLDDSTHTTTLHNGECGLYEDGGLYDDKSSGAMVLHACVDGSNNNDSYKNNDVYDNNEQYNDTDYGDDSDGYNNDIYDDNDNSYNDRVKHSNALYDDDNLHANKLNDDKESDGSTKDDGSDDGGSDDRDNPSDNDSSNNDGDNDGGYNSTNNDGYEDNDDDFDNLDKDGMNSYGYDNTNSYNSYDVEECYKDLKAFWDTFSHQAVTTQMDSLHINFTSIGHQLDKLPSKNLSPLLSMTLHLLGGTLHPFSPPQSPWSTTTTTENEQVQPILPSSSHRLTARTLGSQQLYHAYLPSWVSTSTLSS